jgi:hypothetical protein
MTSLQYAGQPNTCVRFTQNDKRANPSRPRSRGVFAGAAESKGTERTRNYQSYFFGISVTGGLHRVCGQFHNSERIGRQLSVAAPPGSSKFSPWVVSLAMHTEQHHPVWTLLRAAGIGGLRGRMHRTRDQPRRASSPRRRKADFPARARAMCGGRPAHNWNRHGHLSLPSDRINRGAVRLGCTSSN